MVFYDITQNDLVNLADLGTEAKKNINLPVLNDTRAMSNLANFCTILTIFLTKINEHHRKKEMDQLVKEFTTKVNTLNMTL